MTSRTSSRVAALCTAALFATLVSCSSGKDGTNGTNGADGTNGTNGTNGANGTNGTSCTAKANGDGTSTISCTDGTSVTVTGGTNGTNGTDGANGTNGTNGTNGVDGKSCTLSTASNGTRTITCGDGTTVVIPDGSLDYTVLTADELKVANLTAVLTSVTIPADGKPVVTLKISERHGYGIRGMAAPQSTGSNSTIVSFRFALLKLVPGTAAALGVNGAANDTWVSYMASSATATSSTETGVIAGTATAGQLTDNGDGSYSYKFAKNVQAGTSAAGTTYDATAQHRLVILISGSGNPFAPLDLVKDFIPSTGADVTGQNEKVDAAACLECHTTFRAVPDGTGELGTAAFHGGSRYDVRTCVACHNDQRRFQTFGTSSTSEIDGDLPGAIASDGTWTGSLAKVNGEAVIDLPVFIHKIHLGEKLTLQGSYAGLGTALSSVTYPQDVRNCQKCHRAPAAQAANWKSRPSIRACGACHDGVSFVSPAPAGRVLHTGLAQADDSKCGQCHHADDTDLNGKVQHLSVLPPDPAASLFTGGTNSNTNAAYLAATGVVPSGATQFGYVVNSVGVDANLHPTITFKLVDLTSGTAKDVAFTTPPATATSTQELLGGAYAGKFVGGPSVYFVWAVPQDGRAKPADFNMSVSGYVRNLNNKSATGAITGPATIGTVTGLYTVTLTGTTLSSNASMLQGGVGYTYAIPSTQPLTEIDLPAYPTASSPVSPAYLTGGLIVPIADQWKTASGCTTTPVDLSALCTARRGITSSAASTASIVSNAKCNACHVQLGIGPTFHAGQRNDAPSCAFCHKPNQTSAGWSANAKDSIHAIHAAGLRTVSFTWHAASATSSYAQVTYPGVLNKCEMCHNPGTYDFSGSAMLAALPNMLPSTVGVGRYDARATFNPTGWYTIAPYASGAGGYSGDYGYAWSTANVTYTLPDGVSGGSGFDVSGNLVATCSLLTPCTCTATKPCTQTVSGPLTIQGIANVTFTSAGGAGAACTADAPCGCTTNSGSGAKTACVATLKVCTPAAPCDAAPTTLVNSPVVAACSACHDSALEIDHYRANGGTFYEPRSVFATRGEQCLLCHGTNRIASISLVHADKTP